jgi:hypothetical protein
VAPAVSFEAAAHMMARVTAEVRALLREWQNQHKAHDAQRRDVQFVIKDYFLKKCTDNQGMCVFLFDIGGVTACTAMQGDKVSFTAAVTATRLGGGVTGAENSAL